MRKIINNLTQRFILREIGGKGLLVSLKEISPSLIFLNSTAVLVWKTLSADSSVKHCAQMLEKKYDVPKEVAKKT
ncbi:MAG: PqqD family protein [Candidatus Shapirobacteria bacterium]